VGQLVAEAVRFYGSRFWPSIGIGVPPAILVVVAAPLSRGERFLLVLTAGTLLITASYVRACALVLAQRRGSFLVAYGVGVLVFAPVPVVLSISFLFGLPALAWLALVGLVVPVVLDEGRGLRRSFGRTIQLARADYVHVLGGLATLVIVVFLSQLVLFFVLRGVGEAAIAVAGFLANLVMSPVLFLGSALLYDDQAARVRSSKRDGALPRGKPAPPGPVRHPSSR
jgi:hypothetical protein